MGSESKPQYFVGGPMKKISTAGLLCALTLGLTPAQASQSTSIAIIDVSFESELIPGSVTEICLSAPNVCKSTANLRRASDFKAFNHGTVMADVVRTNNPSAHLYLLEVGTTKTGVITGNELLTALNWILANASKNNIKTVSFSYNSGNGDRCTPSSPGVNVRTAHNNIVSAIANLKAAGIKFYASSGNYGSGNRIDYPACIPDALAVGSSDFPGSTHQSDLVLSGPVYSSPRLKSARTAAQGMHDSFAISTTDGHPLMVGFTTSVATAVAVATGR
jgi:hypothetical protein